MFRHCLDIVSSLVRQLNVVVGRNFPKWLFGKSFFLEILKSLFFFSGSSGFCRLVS